MPSLDFFDQTHTILRVVAGPLTTETVAIRTQDLGFDTQGRAELSHKPSVRPIKGAAPGPQDQRAEETLDGADVVFAQCLWKSVESRPARRLQQMKLVQGVEIGQIRTRERQGRIPVPRPMVDQSLARQPRQGLADRRRTEVKGGGDFGRDQRSPPAIATLRQSGGQGAERQDIGLAAPHRGSRRGRPEAFFRDPRATEPAFRDHGRRLSTFHAYPETIADMLKVARHRGWTRLKVEGDEAFRRDVWIQARAQGLEVSGYRPRDRDRQAAGETAVVRAPAVDLDKRLKMAAVVVSNLVRDPEAQRRLLDRAAELVSLRRGQERTERSRTRNSERNR